ncbi:MAG: SIS domain-containing protein [Candidatus Limivicinus sp.]|jgi:D-arabinose 5-phosphate isomerase GutQ
MDDKCTQAYCAFVDTLKNEMDPVLQSMDFDAICQACELIKESKLEGGRVHVSGIGKPAYVAGYTASLLSSTGTPAYFLHGTEAVHGSSGQVRVGDVVIFISNSGETGEMKSTVAALIKNGSKIIGVSGSPDSWLAEHSDVHICAGVEREGGPLNRAPRISILAELINLQAMTVMLQKDEDISPQQYVKWHPGGSLGKLRAEELTTLS